MPEVIKNTLLITVSGVNKTDLVFKDFPCLLQIEKKNEKSDYFVKIVSPFPQRTSISSMHVGLHQFAKGCSLWSVF